MAVKLNRRGFDHAKALIAERRVVIDAQNKARYKFPYLHGMLGAFVIAAEEGAPR